MIPSPVLQRPCPRWILAGGDVAPPFAMTLRRCSLLTPLVAAARAFVTAVRLNSWRLCALLDMGAAGYVAIALHLVVATIRLLSPARASGTDLAVRVGERS